MATQLELVPSDSELENTGTMMEQFCTYKGGVKAAMHLFVLLAWSLPHPDTAISGEAVDIQPR